jgi:hypothetical protein
MREIRMPERRQLSFADLADVMPEVDRLLAGYETVGQWSLGQICNHLATTFHLVTDGIADSLVLNATEDPRFALMRKRLFRSGSFPARVPTPVAGLVPRVGLNDRAEAEALRDALARFHTARGPFPPHPFLGSMTKEEWIRFHCLHTAHHLGFALPLESDQ